MTSPDQAMREALARLFKRYHRDLCYPDCSDGEALIFSDAALLALAPHLDAIRAQARREALEEAARVCDDVWPTSPRKAAAIRKLIDATSA